MKNENIRVSSRYSRMSFDFQPRTRVLFGVHAVEQVGELARGLPAKKVLLVTDAGLVAAGHAARVLSALETAGVAAVLFDRVRENPTTRDVDECLCAAREGGIDAFVGLGGGSSLDTAKGCNFLLTNGGRMRDYWGVGKAAQPLLPLIAIPTTAGTGSECQSFALIADEETHQKMACGDPKAAARVALLDPALTLSQPAHVTSCTGVDALAHAVETAVTRKRNRLSMLFSREAFALGVAELPQVLDEPGDLKARGGMLWAAALAGMAIENSMLGAAHAAANPLTARCGLVHGLAVGMLLPSVVRFNAKDQDARQGYAELAAAAGLVRRNDDSGRAFESLVKRLEQLLNRAGMPRSLAEAGVARTQLPALAEEAARQWTASFNPREATAADFVKLYEAAFEPRGAGERGAGAKPVRGQATDGGRV